MREKSRKREKKRENARKRDKNRKKRRTKRERAKQGKKSEKEEKNRKEAKRDEQSEKYITPRGKKTQLFHQMDTFDTNRIYSRNIFQAVVLGRKSPIRRMKHRREPGRNLSHGNKNYI